MRFLLALALAGCGGKSAGPAPDPKAFAAMTEEQKCDATAPRGTLCIEEIMAMQVRQLAGSDTDFAKEIGAELKDGPRSTGDEALTIHRSNCRGDKKFTDAVFACWAEPDCNALTVCIEHRTR